MNRAAEAALRRALRQLVAPQRGVPMTELVRLGRDTRGRALTLDLASTQRIGAPVIVLRPPSVAADSFLGKLTRRETEVAALLAAGWRNAAIARRLGISLATVKDHVHHVLVKTGMPSRTALAAALARAGL